MNRVTGIGNAGMMRFHVDLAQYFQAGPIDLCKQFGARAQTQMFCKIGEYQPPLAAGFKVYG